MRLKETVQQAVVDGRLDDLDDIVAGNVRAVRFLLGMTYRTDATIRSTAARAIARASRYHKKAVAELVRRLVWAMNDESGANALTAPAVVRAIAEEQPDLLLPMVPDLTRLAGDEGLRKDLSAALKIVARACPGEVGNRLAGFLNAKGEGCGC
ncbi:MAG TPA: hypothetical protein VM425_18455 [Myxococcota bacterium]|nr:hypothetical protein [Myxococcota bacterium]